MSSYRSALGLRVSRATLSTLLGLQVFAATAALAQDGPAEFDVDPAAAERALERTLVESGVLLLPQGRFEIEPSLRYEYSEIERFTRGRVDGDLTLGRRVVKRNELTSSLAVRYGLPGDAQVELTLPFIYVDQDVDEGFFPVDAEGSDSGFGNVSLGIAKTLLRESNGRPDVVGRLSWNTDSGDDSVSSDFNEVQASLSALWRLDPVALSAGIAYGYTFEKDDFQPGEVFGVNLGTSLAASPTVALGMNFNVSYRNDSSLNGNTVADSSQNQASISFSIASIVGRNTLLNVEFGAGLTEDAPDYFAAVSLPVRF